MSESIEKPSESVERKSETFTLTPYVEYPFEAGKHPELEKMWNIAANAAGSHSVAYMEISPSKIAVMNRLVAWGGGERPEDEERDYEEIDEKIYNMIKADLQRLPPQQQKEHEME